MRKFKDFNKISKNLVLQIVVLLFLGIVAMVFILSNALFTKSNKQVLAEETLPSSLAGYVGSDLAVDDSAENTYFINNANDLRSLAYWVNTKFDEAEVEKIGKQKKYTSSSYNLTSHLDLSAWNWEPIGTNDNPFIGNFNGAGHSIYGLTIIDDLNATPGKIDTYAGLFGLVKYAEIAIEHYTPHIQRLGLKDTVIVTNRTYVGSIVACGEGSDPAIFETKTNIRYNIIYGEDDTTPSYSNATGSLIIQDCYNVGYVQGGANVGGLAGYLSHGAGIYNCYNAPMSKIVYNQKYDVYSNDIEANVGGIVGSAVNSDVAVLKNCINSALVSRVDVEAERDAGKATEIQSSVYITNIGFLIGNKLNAGDSKPYNKNIYIYKDYKFKSDYGSAYDIDHKPEEGDLKWSKFFVKQFLTGDWGNQISQIWSMQSNVNSGIPVLSNVPQLIKYDIIAKDSNDQVIAPEDAKGAFNIGDFVLKNETNGYYLFEQGKTFIVDSTISAKYKYDFARWDIKYMPTTNNQGLLCTNESTLISAQFFTYHDASMIAKFDFKEYNVKAAISQADYCDIANSSITVGTSAVLINAANTATYLDTAEFKLVTKPGYYVKSWSADYSNALTAGETTTTVTLDVETYLKAFILAHPSEELPTDIIVTALINPEIYDITFSASSDAGTVSASKGEDVELNAEDKISFGDTLKLVAEVDAEGYQFVGWEINDVLYKVNKVYSFTIGDYETGKIKVVGVFGKKKYTVSIDPDARGELSFTDSKTNVFEYGSKVKISSTAKHGYVLTGFNINDSVVSGSNAYYEIDLTNNTLTINSIKADITCKGIFDFISYDLTLNLNLEDGATVVLNTTENSLLGTNAFDYNSFVDFKINLVDGYILKEVKDNSGTIYTAISDGNIFKAHITDDLVIDIIIEIEMFDVRVNLDVEDNLTYSLGQGCVRGEGTFAYGSPVNLTIVYPEMFEFTGWTVNGEPLGDDILVDVTKVSVKCDSLKQNIYLTATFKIKNVKVSFDAVGIPNGDSWYTVDDEVVKAKSDMQRDYGKVVYFQLLSYYNNSITFSHWEVNGIVYSRDNGIGLSVETEDLNVKAVFTPNSYAVETHVSIWNTNNNAYDEVLEAGVITGLTSNIIKYGDKVELSVINKKGYRFIGWYLVDSDYVNGRGTKISTQTNLEYTITGNSEIYANFEQIANIDVNVIASNSGTITGTGKYVKGDNVVLTATALPGFRFVNWLENGEVVSVEQKYAFKNNGNDKILTAVFEPVLKVVCTTNNENYGKVIGNSTGIYNDNIVLKAVSENNCSFVGWVINDIVISNSDTLSLNLNGDLEVRALFKKNFDWNILIILGGCFLFAGILIAGSASYIKMKEAEPMPVRKLLASKDDKDLLVKGQKRNPYRDNIRPIPTRKNTKSSVAPIPVRKITVSPINHKGELVGRKQKAKEEKASLKTEQEK